MAEFRKVHPVQCVHREYAGAAGPGRLHGRCRRATSGWRRFTSRSAIFPAGLAATRFELLPCAGTYFQTARYAAISDQPDTAFVDWLTREVGVAAIPCRPFRRRARREGDPLLLCQARGHPGRGFRAPAALLLNSKANSGAPAVRNIALFILFLIGLFYVRAPCAGAPGRAEARGPGAGGCADAAAGRGAGDRADGALRPLRPHVPESEGVRGAGGFFCSEEHRRLGPRR